MYTHIHEQMHTHTMPYIEAHSLINGMQGEAHLYTEACGKWELCTHSHWVLSKALLVRQVAWGPLTREGLWC